MCGSLKDRFGVSWQIVTRALRRMLADADARRAAQVVVAIMRMTKIEIVALERAYAGS